MLDMTAAHSVVSRRAANLTGEARPPGDKSVSHRALILGAVAVGETNITGLLEGDDVLATATAMNAMGAVTEKVGAGAWRVVGRGVGGLTESGDILDMGNAGTGARLMTGLLAAHPFTSFLTGDASLRSRPMERVMGPLRQMGATFVSCSGGRLPMAVIGSGSLVPITYELPVASAQVKSAVLLAGLNTAGVTTVIEPAPTRDHSERMLRHFGAEVAVDILPGGGRSISLVGQPELTAGDIVVPGDPSSAAFPLVAALIAAEGRVVLRGVGVNPLRAGLIDCLLEMGANLTLENMREEGGEPVADIIVISGPLTGIDVTPERAPSMIDEYPVLAVAAAFASGTTRMRGVGELRVKESDRLKGMAEGLAACGVRVEAREDELIVHGNGKPPRGGGRISTQLDHRIAMAFLVLGVGAEEPVSVDDARPVDTSFPGFAEMMNDLGARIGPETMG
jgi:3-phosphoshikimate 1-carboxyvinyltransferase